MFVQPSRLLRIRSATPTVFSGCRKMIQPLSTRERQRYRQVSAGAENSPISGSPYANPTHGRSQETSRVRWKRPRHRRSREMDATRAPTLARSAPKRRVRGMVSRRADNAPGRAPPAKRGGRSWCRPRGHCSPLGPKNSISTEPSSPARAFTMSLRERGGFARSKPRSWKSGVRTPP